MTATSTGRTGREPGRRRRPAPAWRALAAVLALAGCSSLGPPPMEPLTAATLEAAQRRWQAHGSDAYHLVVRVRAPRFEPAVYDLVVAGGEPVEVARNGEPLRREDAARHDYSVSGLFELLRDDLSLTAVRRVGDTPPIDLRARFEPETGRLVRYRRTVGTARRRVLLVEVLAFEPHVSRAAR
ncbi:MAG: hypothetical protein AB1689_04250 [Thermodesulfobacteriota bacterium]